MKDVYIPFELFCDVGGVIAEVMVRINDEVDESAISPQDNSISYVTSPCIGCRRWTLTRVRQTEDRIINESLRNFGSSHERLTGIRDGRFNMLEQHIVDRSRFVDEANNQLVVATCSPISLEEI